MRSNELVLLPTKLQPEGRPQNAPLSHCQARAQPHSAASPSHACCATGEAPASEVQPLPPLCTEPKALEVDEQHLRSLDNRELLREVLPATNIAAERGNLQGFLLEASTQQLLREIELGVSFLYLQVKKVDDG